MEDAEDLGEYWTYGSNASGRPLSESFKNAATVYEAGPDELAELIQQTDDRDRLRYLRVQMWHIHNNTYRNPEVKGNVQKPSSFDTNLKCLIGLLEDDRAQNQLMKAEALRQIQKAICILRLESRNSSVQTA